MSNTRTENSFNRKRKLCKRSNIRALEVRDVRHMHHGSRLFALISMGKAALHKIICRYSVLFEMCDIRQSHCVNARPSTPRHEMCTMYIHYVVCTVGLSAHIDDRRCLLLFYIHTIEIRAAKIYSLEHWHRD